MTLPGQTPKSVLIIGSGCFGLSTAIALAKRPAFQATVLTLLDASTFPAAHISSIDTSRVIRSDYATPAYAALAAEAHDHWRMGDWGKDGRYTEAGLVLTASDANEHLSQCYKLAKDAATRAKDFDAITDLHPAADVKAASMTGGGGSGTWGYTNHRAGWADAEAAMIYARKLAEGTHRIHFMQGKAIRLLKSSDGKTVVGALLGDGRELHADLTIVAMGAWTPTLLDLEGRVAASGEVLAYVRLTDAEEARLHSMPTLLNLGSGVFITPPRNNLLKIGRHGYGYANPTLISHPELNDKSVEISVPWTIDDDPRISVPIEGQEACRLALQSAITWLADREFDHTRLCWYTDTRSGDFIIDYYPDCRGCFVATGGSGHGFKFLPIIGERIVDCIQGKLKIELRDVWRFPDRVTGSVVTSDGTRAGRMGMILKEELKARRSVL